MDAHRLLARLAQHEGVWIASTALSIAIYAAVAISVPVALARLPPDYLVCPPRPESPWRVALRFVIGIVVILAGVAMLVLPGPGILTILLGLMIIGGRMARRWVRAALLANRRIFDAMNALRTKRGRPPLIHPDDAHGFS